MSQTSRPRKTKTLDSARSASNSVNQICTIRIELRDSDPLIWRQVEVPTSITLEVLVALHLTVRLSFEHNQALGLAGNVRRCG